MIENLIVNSYLSIEMAGYVWDVNYFQIDSVVVLKPFSKKIQLETTHMA